MSAKDRKKPAARRQERKAAKEAAREKRAPVRAMTAGQTKYLEQLKEFDCVIAYGPAGTGKTYVPTSHAADLYQWGVIDQIILCRPAVEAGGEKHGFLPGAIGKKMEPWVAPVMDVLKEKLGATKVDQMYRDGVIQVVPFSYMRGKTLKRAFIMLDEAQNTTVEQMKLFTGRFGEDVKIAINGDIEQCDLHLKENGLSAMVKLAADPKLPVGIVEFTIDDVVRSGLCKQFLLAWRRYEGKDDEGSDLSHVSFLRDQATPADHHA